MRLAQMREKGTDMAGHYNRIYVAFGPGMRSWAEWRAARGKETINAFLLSLIEKDTAEATKEEREAFKAWAHSLDRDEDYEAIFGGKDSK